MPADDMGPPRRGLQQAYGLNGPDEVNEFYAGWAEEYDAEIAENGYVTPGRCAEALAQFVTDKSAPIMDLACGTGLSGAALTREGFSTIDGFDLTPEMLDEARGKGIYRSLARADLSQPLDMAEGAYTHAVAVGCLSPDYMPVTVLDEVLSKLPSGGCFAFSINDYAADEGSFPRHLNEICDCWTAEMLFREYGEHIPGTGLKATVYVLRKR